MMKKGEIRLRRELRGRKVKKQALAAILAVAMTVGLVPPIASANDIGGHWAEPTITDWQNRGLVQGYEDGTFKPNNNVTRAEFVTIINNAMGFQSTGEVPFTDVAPDQWYHKAVASAIAQGYCRGYQDNTFRPNKTISREEAAVMIANAKGLPQDAASAANFPDIISEWAKGSVGAVAKAGYMRGYPDGTFGASRPITRAEAVVSLNNAAEGVQGKATDVVIEKSKTILTDQNITGNLIVAESVGEGEATVKNSVIKGDLVVKGGGLNSVYLENVTVEGKIIVEKKNVKIQLDGKTNASDIVVNETCKLTTKGLEAPIASVTIAEALRQGKRVIIDIPVENLNIHANASVELHQDMENVFISQNGSEAKVMIASGVIIDEMTINGKIELYGTGKVKKVNVNISNVQIAEGVKIDDLNVTQGVQRPNIRGNASASGSSGSTSSKPEPPKPEPPKPEPPKPEPPKPEPPKPEPQNPEPPKPEPPKPEPPKPEPPKPEPPKPEPEDHELEDVPMDIKVSSSTVSVGYPVDLVAIKVNKFGQRVVVPAQWELSSAVEGAKIENNQLIVDEMVSEGTEIHVQARQKNGISISRRIQVAKPQNQGTLIHFYKRDGNYQDWNYWSWTEGKEDGEQVDFAISTDMGQAAYLTKNRVIARKRANGNDWAEQTKTYVIPDNCANAYMIQGDDTIYTSLEQALKATNARIRSVMMDERNQMIAYLTDAPKEGVTFELLVDGIVQKNIPAKMEGDKVVLDTTSIAENFDPTSLIEVRGVGMFNIPQQVTLRHVLDAYYYDGSDMGATYDTNNSISCKLWAPTACKVDVMVYDSHETNPENGTAYPMKLDPSTGIYSGTLNWNEAYDRYYLYRLTFKTRNLNGTIGERVTYAVDPYAEAVGLNGTKGYFLDIENDERTIPEGFKADQRPALGAPEDSIIYEMHVRDFTIDENWGGTEAYRGKYLGIVEEGTKYTKAGHDPVTTGLDHLKELGITHVHLLPTYDIASIDETNPNARNWGYDPLNYNAPEGSYATDPANPVSRIKEFRQMVMGLHDAKIRVVLDQVYNHMASTDNMDKIVPGYYFRTWEDGTLSNGSGCGNEVASERPMVRKFIVDSNLHWVNDYNVDGLRFDLMALLDRTTMKKVKQQVQQIDHSIILYGEPWMADRSPLPEHEQTKKDKGISAFNDYFRDALRGNNDPSQGFVNGAISGDNSGKVQQGLRSQSANHFDPELTINYAEAHDNYAIWDQIIKNEGKDGEGYRPADIGENAMESWKVKKAVLANAMVLTAQGVPFFQGGSEILRTKNGDHNSYKSNDETNDIDWSDKAEYKEVFDYYAGLIKLRKEHPAFRINDQKTIKNHQDVYRLYDNDGIILQHLKNNANGDAWANILVIYNGTTSDQNLSWLPKAHGEKWNVAVKGGQVSLGGPIDTLTVQNGNYVNYSIPSSSLMVLYDTAEKIPDLRWDYLFADQSTDYMEPMEPTSQEPVKVRFRAATGDVTDATVHWYDAGTGQTNQLPMQKVADDFYERKGYDSQKIEFWEATLPPSPSTRYYNFEVRNTKANKTAWISGGKGDNNRGVTNQQPTMWGGSPDYGFSIVPDYKTLAWAKESVFYQIMVDRFRDGDKRNNRVAMDVATQGAPSEISKWGDEIYSGNESDHIWNNQFFGGDLIGVQEAIPYLKDILGVDTLYLMPIFQSGSDHKYDIDDYNFVDKNFGGNQSLVNLSDELHTEDMHLVLDGVFNHTSTNTEWFKKNKSNYYFTGDFTDNGGNKIDFYPWHGHSNLAKLDYSKADVADAIYRNEDSVAKRYLKAPFNIDGWRLDAAEDVNTKPRDHQKDQHSTTNQTDAEQKAENLRIWSEFRTEVNKVSQDKYILGEYWGDENQWFNGKAWDGKMNYGGFMMPFVKNSSSNKWLGNQSLDNKSGMSVADIGIYTREYFKKIPYAAVLNSTNSISSHDQPRFLNQEYTGAGNVGMMELAATLQMTYPGIPMIYYGDEIGMVGKDGGADPYNRGTFNWNTDQWNHEMLKDHSKLIAARKANKDAFVYGAFEEIASHQEDKYLVYARYGNGEQAIVVLNNHGDRDSEISITDVERFGLKDGDVLVDVLGNAPKITISNSEAKLTSNKMAASVYVKQDKTGNPTDISSLKLNAYADPRIVLNAVENVGYTVSGQEVTVTWEAYRGNTDGAKAICVRLYDTTNRNIAEQQVEMTATSATLTIPDGISEYSVAVKVCADRTVEDNGIGDAYADSVYTVAVNQFADTVDAEKIEVPVEDLTVSSEEVEAPAEDLTVPSEEVEAPAEDPTVPSEEVEAPVEDLTVPSEEMEAPAEDLTVPSEEMETPEVFMTVYHPLEIVPEKKNIPIKAFTRMTI